MTDVRVSIGRGRPDAEVPTSGPLVDRHGRVHTDVRLSVTDRCNFRCVHCLPDEDVAFTPRSELLSIEELLRVAEVLQGLGIRTVRITGGEPLVRAGVVDFVAGLSALGFDDVALTTNASRLTQLAPSLAAAGLRRVNVSLDSLRSERFAAIRRRGELATVLAGMDAAEAAGLGPVKVNVVLLAGQNDDEVLDFADFARRTGRPVRFIEYMPLDSGGLWDRSAVVAGADVRARIAERWPLEPVPPAAGHDGVVAVDPAPAERFRFADGMGEVGFVSSVTEPFCGTCNRLRITADGAVRNCLFSDDERPLRDLLRSAASQDRLARSIRESVWGKLPGHGIDDPSLLRTAFHRPVRSMSAIGG